MVPLFTLSVPPFFILTVPTVPPVTANVPVFSTALLFSTIFPVISVPLLENAPFTISRPVLLSNAPALFKSPPICSVFALVLFTVPALVRLPSISMWPSTCNVCPFCTSAEMPFPTVRDFPDGTVSPESTVKTLSDALLLGCRITLTFLLFR